MEPKAYYPIKYALLTIAEPYAFLVFLLLEFPLGTSPISGSASVHSQSLSPTQSSRSRGWEGEMIEQAHAARFFPKSPWPPKG